MSAAYGLPLDPGRLVGELSVGERQRVEIVRCLLQNPRLLIMDEPTSVLTPQEVEALFGTLRRLAGEGCSILYISHKLDEIRALCDRATVLRGGKVVAHCDPRQETARSLAEMMIGATLTSPVRESRRPAPVRLVGQRPVACASDRAFGVDLEDVIVRSARRRDRRHRRRRRQRPDRADGGADRRATAGRRMRSAIDGKPVWPARRRTRAAALGLPSCRRSGSATARCRRCRSAENALLSAADAKRAGAARLRRRRRGQGLRRRR